MLRSVGLSDPTVVGLLKDHFVPVARPVLADTNNSESAPYLDKALVGNHSAEERLVRQFAGNAVREWQWAACFTPEGELLSLLTVVKPQVAPPASVALGTYGEGGPGLARILRAALEKSEKLPARRASAKTLEETLPDRGVGLHADGSVRLALTGNKLEKNGQSLRLRLPTGDQASLTFASVFLTREEWKAFTAPRVKAGQRFDLPQEILSTFVRALSPACGSPSFYSPKFFKGGQLTGEVVTVQGGSATVRWAGRIEAGKGPGEGVPEKAEGTLEGYMEVDREGKPLSLLLIVESTFRNRPPYHELQRHRAAIEWTTVKDKEQRTPSREVRK